MIVDSHSQLIILAAVALTFGLFSRRLEATLLTPPMLFVGLGMLFASEGLGWLNLGTTELVDRLAEVTLILVLFTDASRIDVRALSQEKGLPIRLLGIGMPLTIVAGVGVAYVCFPEFGLWELAVLAAVLAPTDAALGQAVVSSPVVPMRIRQALNVESGLNDGIALPFIMLFAAMAAATDGAATGSATHWTVYWVMQVTLGPLAGVLVGAGGGFLVRWAADREWMNHSFRQLTGLLLAVLAYALALQIGGNGFIAAFVAGMSLGCVSQKFCGSLQQFMEAEGQLLALLTFLLLGTTLVWSSFQMLTVSAVVYAVLSLTAIRMIPVALSLIGSGVKRPTVYFLGWFGPRGLASLLFGLLILEKSNVPHREEIFPVIIITVVMSVLAHGVTAVPGAKMYARALEKFRDDNLHEHREVTEHRVKIRHSK